MSTPASISRPTTASGFSTLVLQGYNPSTSGYVWDPDNEAAITEQGSQVTRHGFCAFASFMAAPPQYGDAHPVFTGMGLTGVRASLRANGELLELWYTYTAGLYGYSLGTPTLPSDELSSQGSPESVNIQLHPGFYNDLGGFTPFAQYWDFLNQEFFVALPGGGYSPDFLWGLKTYIRQSTVLTIVQYKNSPWTAQYDIVGSIVEVPTLNIWGVLPGEAWSLEVGLTGQWLCVDFDIGQRGQWFYRRVGFQLSATAWPTDLYPAASLA